MEDQKMASRVFTRLTTKDSALLVCDLQEKFRQTIIKFPEVVTVAARLVAAATTLEMPIIGTEQYPKGLGHLVPELNLPEKTPIFDKTKFSMCIPPVEQLLSPTPKSVILCGIEAHVCVLQTTLDLLEKGITVHVVADATSSRSAVDRAFAFKQMEKAGAILTTSECVILGLCGGADHPKFKQIQKIIMESAPDTGISLSHI
uniref:Isochorismatase domain-containing protein 1 n=1 Tax=Pristionchus pacificus TaxID=54126 RepID=A0A2A6CB31_PRIPA|eukprot:PDM75327.1 marb-1 [Pristionchus pacificus]